MKSHFVECDDTAAVWLALRLYTSEAWGMILGFLFVHNMFFSRLYGFSLGTQASSHNPKEACTFSII